jgi:putative integral membrane protein (TIGR02587 family)
VAEQSLQSGRTERGRAGRLSELDRKFFIGLARAFAGALIFGLPLLMTMEMWWIGFHIEPSRLALLILLEIPLLTALSRVIGFKETRSWTEDLVDAFVAIAVAALAGLAVLAIFSVVQYPMPANEIVGKMALQTFPGSIGAMLALDQLSGEEKKEHEKQPKRHPTYATEMFLMSIGALFLGLNVAPTEEIMLLSYMMGPWREVALALLTLVVMHGFVYAVEFPGRPERHPEATFLSLFLRFTVAGYGLVLIIALYLLWTFGRTDGTSLQEIVSAAVILGFPCAIGAAAARLIL